MYLRVYVLLISGAIVFGANLLSVYYIKPYVTVPYHNKLTYHRPKSSHPYKYIQMIQLYCCILGCMEVVYYYTHQYLKEENNNLEAYVICKR